jgi:hypothetical protein
MPKQQTNDKSQISNTEHGSPVWILKFGIYLKIGICHLLFLPHRGFKSKAIAGQ